MARGFRSFNKGLPKTDPLAGTARGWRHSRAPPAAWCSLQNRAGSLARGWRARRRRSRVGAAPPCHCPGLQTPQRGLHPLDCATGLSASSGPSPCPQVSLAPSVGNAAGAAASRGRPSTNLRSPDMSPRSYITQEVTIRQNEHCLLKESSTSPTVFISTGK